MRYSIKILNIEIGIFYRRRFDFISLFKRINFSDYFNNGENDIELSRWEYDAPLDKRFHVVTGYNLETKEIDSKGLIQFAFNNLDIECLTKPVYPYKCFYVIDGIIDACLGWRDTLIKVGATDSHIELFDKIIKNNVNIYLEILYGKNLYIYTSILSHYNNHNNEYFKKLFDKGE